MRHHHRRHNPFGFSGAVIKDVVAEVAGFAGANYGSSFLKQSGWTDVLATGAVAFGIHALGKSVAGEPLAEELFKGGVFAAVLKAIKQTGVAIPGLGLYVPTYFSAPTTSDAYGRATAPTLILPAPAAAGGAGMGAGPMGIPYGRYRSRFMTRF